MSRSRTNSARLFSEAQSLIPGGVNSPVRAFKAVGGNPLFIESAQGCRLRDVDGNEYIDYVGSWGPLILGHAHPDVVRAIQQAALRGTSYGAPTPLEVELARKIHHFFPSMERVRLVSSGTEAVMSALRVARAFTGRDKILKFDGCYHGHSDSLLVQSGSGVATLGLPDSAGVPSEFTSHTLSIPFNDLEALEKAFTKYKNQIAAVIVEPVPANMGVILPGPNFLSELLLLCRKHQTLVIFDEVITGFRLAAGGAQEFFGLSAPLTCLGKIVGGGLPLAAYGGRSDIMKLIAPDGPVYQAGTLSGNPIAVSAGLKTLDILETEKPYGRLEKMAAKLVEGISQAASHSGIALRVQRCGSMLTPFFSDAPVTDFLSAKRSDTSLFGSFFRKMLERGIYLAPSQFEACFVSSAHSDQEIAVTIQRANEALSEVAASV
ncbi:MAG: glutamate-1-semialdehyde 2,1-aminomutase [Acidobacteria bacterium]|nr:glutamate-1-semialdehyde 2,1-aminomutase [Acidobacteriota bacterium]